MKTIKNLTLAALATAAFAAQCAIGPTQSAMADPDGVKGHTFHVTFTKWALSMPNPPSLAGVLMEGVVGGDVGTGTFSGEVLSASDNGAVATLEAVYHFHGSKHSFTARVTVMEDDVTLLAVITGRVTEGWLEGTTITGEYKDWLTCPIPTPGNIFGYECFQGALDIKKDSKD